MAKEAELERSRSDLNKMEAEGESGQPVHSPTHHLLASHVQKPIADGDCQVKDNARIVKDNLEESQLSPVSMDESVFPLCIPETPDYQQRKSRVRIQAPHEQDTDQSSFSAREKYPGLENETRKCGLDAADGQQNDHNERREKETSHNILSYITSKFSFSQVLDHFLKVNGAEINSDTPLNEEEEEDSFNCWDSSTTNSTPSSSDKSLENSPRIGTNIVIQGEEQTESTSPSCPEHSVCLNPTLDQDRTSDSVSLQKTPCIQVNDGRGLSPGSGDTCKNATPSTESVTEGQTSAEKEATVDSLLIPHAGRCNDLQVTPQTGPDNKLLMTLNSGSCSEGRIELKIGCSDDRSITPISRKSTTGSGSMRSPFVMKQHTGLVTKRRRRRRQSGQSGAGDQTGASNDTLSPTCKQLCQWQDVSELSLSEVDCQSGENLYERPVMEEESLVTERPVTLTTEVFEDCPVSDTAAN